MLGVVICDMIYSIIRTQTFSMESIAEQIRSGCTISLSFEPMLIWMQLDDFFLVMTFIYIIDVMVRWYGLGWNSFRANGWNIFDIVVAFGTFLTTFIVRFGATSFVVQQLQKLFLVSIAFKLVQRTNSLNMLFKTAVYVPRAPLLHFRGY